MFFGLGDVAASFVMPVIDGTSSTIRWIFRPFQQSHYFSQSVHYAADQLGPAKPYIAIFGSCAIVYYLGRASWMFWRGTTSYFLAGPLHLGWNLQKLTMDGGWAVVTGATDGLGLAFAKEVAKRGSNVILVGRHAEKLDMVAREIEAQYRVKADMLVIDFRSATVLDYQKVKKRLSKLRVDILVNSVGMASGSLGSFGSQPDTEQLCLDLLNVNVIPMLMFTNSVLPGMKSRRKGVIINVSSIAALYPLPNYALYGATKAMVDFFSAGLDRECRQYGIFVQCLLPGPVLTNMTRSSGKSFFIVQPGPFVRDALSQVGLRRRTFGHWIHAILATIAQPIPLWITLRFLQPKNQTTHIR